MASELKHPEWIWYGEDDEGNSHISTGRWATHVCQMRYKLAEIQPTEHDHTRPAPAATDTGLVTVAQIDTGRKWRVHFLSHPVRGEELVTRSQAEELLAAERALADTATRQNALLWKRNEALEAENAAKIEYLRHWQHKWAQSENERQALEAKLAAAEKALEPFAAVLDDYDPEDENDFTPGTLVIGSATNYDITLGDLRKARAALGVKTS